METQLRRDQKYLYVMQCNNFVKFGISKRQEYRIKELQIGNPYKITLLLKVVYDNCYQIENKVHRYFDDKHETGEWFSIDDSIKTFVKYLKHTEYELSKR